MLKNKKLISIIVPVYNEEENIKPIYEAIIQISEKIKEKYDIELIFTDNNSTDTTFEKLRDLYEVDNRIRVFRFSRNFGYQRSILAGYLKARGLAVIQIDCDLQDPPELILEFLKSWEMGFKVVYGIRRGRKENFLINLLRKLFYRLINYLSDDELPHDAGDFRLIDRILINELKYVDDSQPYLRGLIASMGFKQYGIIYDRNERKRGKSNFKYKDLIGLALNGILNHSIIPLRLATFFGLTVMIVTLIGITYYAIIKIFFGVNWPAGFTTLTILILTGICLNAIFLGIIGEYIGRIYQQVKKRPLVIYEDTLDDFTN